MSDSPHLNRANTSAPCFVPVSFLKAAAVGQAAVIATDIFQGVNGFLQAVIHKAGLARCVCICQNKRPAGIRAAFGTRRGIFSNSSRIFTGTFSAVAPPKLRKRSELALRRENVGDYTGLTPPFDFDNDADD